MSRVYFHTQDHGTAELRGSERAWMGCLINDMMLAAIGPLRHARDWLLPMIPADHYLHSVPDFERSAATAMTVGDLTLRGPTGDIDIWSLALNTAMDIGGDEIKLFARLHGQCELHCYIEGAKDKRRYAGIIAEGLKKGLMRKGVGWESVATLLREAGEHPVVCSYSVCDSFPNFGMLPAGHPLKQRDDEDRWDEFYKIPEAEKWDLCMPTLREDHGLRLEYRNNIRFMHGISVFGLRELLREKAVVAA